MTPPKHSLYFLLLCLTVSLGAVYFILKPFFGPLILSAMCAFLFQPLYKKILRPLGKHERTAAFITTIIAVILVMLPTALLGSQIFKESSQLYHSLAGGGDSFISILEAQLQEARAYLPIPESFHIDFYHYLRQALNLLTQNLDSIFSSLAKFLLHLIVFIAAFYFLLKDGHRLKQYLITLSPLADRDDHLVVARLEAAVSAVVKGNLSIGLIQGALTGVGFALFGVPNPVLWGSFAAIAALLPGIGTALVITPAVLFLFFTGHLPNALGLLIWGMLAVGLIDNVLGPKLIGKGIRLHPFMVFLAVLGGISAFGSLGFLLGPLAMSLCLAFIEIYFSLKGRKTQT